MSTLTICLSNRAPKTIVEEEWPILVSTPESNKSQDLIVRLRNTDEFAPREAVIYGQKGAGISEIPGAGLYAGHYISCDTDEAKFMDRIAETLFAVGSDLGMDVKRVWILVRELKACAL